MVRERRRRRSQWFEERRDMKLIGKNLFAAIAIALVTTFAASTPAMADSNVDEWVHFYNDGYLPVYVDIYAYDAQDNLLSHEWSGTQYHSGGKWFKVPAGTARVFWEVRQDPFGNTVRLQNMSWYNFNEYCTDGKHATIYVGGPGSPHSYDMHCSNW
jgi:hypothetical protein